MSTRRYGSVSREGEPGNGQNEACEQKHVCRRPQTPMLLVNEISKLFFNIMRARSDVEQHSYRSILFHLAHRDGRTQLELVKCTHLKPPTVSVTLHKMEQDGYVYRCVDESDQRQTRVFLTEKGRQHEETVKAVIHSVEEKIMAGFSEEETALLKSYLERMRDNIFEEGRAAGEQLPERECI